ncbi:GNAT family N-acetyltransferase [Chryseobacterium arthrosphaerae]|uniref:GNAT family N-acetyltransferase n=1 Tax=Chryseobacterium arthrosphaerae TaxID=651561 RepID=A0A3S0N9B2_9FLAO|nr:GNAT family N-acetyltransferase [Chryseobacterium arthrosphaerae]AYZ14295.1 GNAT family N-acetyltransferase [Chryseobacterium arthrosphaerae]MDG4654699.1 GNAT family N-acetyltransferase [Chryseobacterium arthrosphaerae]RTZ50238.1 GNAT family N-acetyltransferase [Chryseobacterium arthrosphaerae]UEQ75018.1 GNAT family N-acetyltransferase [Chryseobacterium arthrosphaerae]WES96268.1 GNAT family N-acetyltransferase [Chryseobacterium arthrosphaerae]
MSNIVWKIKTFDEFTVPELYAVLKARIDVFVIEQNCPYPDLDNYDQKAVHIWAEEDGQVLAYCRVFDKGIKYEETSIGRVLTTEQARGKSLGKLLIQYAVETIENRFHTPEIRISAQDYLLRFYGGFGFEDTGKKYLEDDIPHTEMIRK